MSRDERDRETVEAVRAVLGAVAARAEVARRLDEGAVDRLLRSIVEATAALFDAEAASIALVDADGRLRFRVAAGERGQGVVGLTVARGEGIAGFVLASGQPLAVADVSADPRFDRVAAERTGYVPRSLLAVPLETDERVIGVLEVLDRRGRPAFDLRDVSLAAVFARQAAAAIEVTAVDRDVAALLSGALAALAGGRVRPASAETLASDAVAAMDAEAGGEFWAVVDRLARLRAVDPDRVGLVVDVLETALRHLAPGHGAEGARPTWRDRLRVPGG